MPPKRWPIFGEDIGTMTALVDRALALNSNFARGWLVSGTLRLWAGQSDIAIEHAEASLRLSPRVRTGTLFLVIGAAHFASRRFGQAVPKLLLAIQDDPGFPLVYLCLAACYAHMGRLDDAREIVAQLRAITPVVVPDVGFLRNPEHRELPDRANLDQAQDEITGRLAHTLNRELAVVAFGRTQDRSRRT